MNLVYPWTNAYYMTPGHVIDYVRFYTMHLGSAGYMNACNQTISSTKLIRYIVYFCLIVSLCLRAMQPVYMDFV